MDKEERNEEVTHSKGHNLSNEQVYSLLEESFEKYKARVKSLKDEVQHLKDENKSLRDEIRRLQE
jgi:predicted  nucleic acid-binding Zn-ribbon protein